MVSVVSTWAATESLPSGYSVPPPAAQSLAVPVANTGQGGNWLFALCSWRTPAPGILTTVAVGDDAHGSSPGCNVWEPLGAPSGTSPLSGYMRPTMCLMQTDFPVPYGPMIMEIVS